MNEIIFEVKEDEIDGGYTASALGYGIHTEAENLEELRRNTREAVEYYFGALSFHSYFRICVLPFSLL